MPRMTKAYNYPKKKQFLARSLHKWSKEQGDCTFGLVTFE